MPRVREKNSAVGEAASCCYGTSRRRRCFLANILQSKNQTIDLLPHQHPHQQLMPSPAALPVYDTSKWLEDFFMLLYRSVAKYCTFARYALRLSPKQEHSSAFCAVAAKQLVAASRAFSKLPEVSEFLSPIP